MITEDVTHTSHGGDATRLRWCDACAEHVMPGHRHPEQPRTWTVTADARGVTMRVSEVATPRVAPMETT